MKVALKVLQMAVWKVMYLAVQKAAKWAAMWVALKVLSSAGVTVESRV
jgi:hypothetical protein